MPKGIPSEIPNRQQLRHWETVCRFLDAQPFRAVTYPFPHDPPISTRLLKRMACFQLVRHRDDCRWQLSRRWQPILTRLWNALPDEECAPTVAEALTQPFNVDRGVDTLYANLLSPDGLPSQLITTCDALKAKAQDEDTTVETPWSVLGAPLSIFKAGKGTSGGGRGVSWSYILRNAMVMLVLRKTPLNRLLGSARFSAEALWSLGPRAALDGARADLRHVWTWAGKGDFEAVRWQLSQIHLCVDVANFAPAPADLNRLLCRSLKKIVHLPSSADVDAALFVDDEGDLAGQDAAWLAGVVPPEWESVPLAAYDPADLALLDANERDPDDDTTVDGDVIELELADEQGASVHLWGQRASGFSFSPGADLSAAWYDKALQERQSGKRWMEAIHRAGGWEPSMPLFRVEARFRRGVLRELTGAHGNPDGAYAGAPDWFEDPWVALDHLNDLWAYFAGLPPEADTAPDVTYRGWMRLVTPDEHDTNRSRWPTDPIWLLIQRAGFTDAATPAALTRHPKVAHNLDQVDAELYGLLKLRAALRGEYLDTNTTLSLELRAFASRMDEVDAERERDFAEEVREKARMLGKPLPLRPISMLLPGVSVSQR